MVRERVSAVGGDNDERDTHRLCERCEQYRSASEGKERERRTPPGAASPAERRVREFHFFLGARKHREEPT